MSQSAYTTLKDIPHKVPNETIVTQIHNLTNGVETAAPCAVVHPTRPLTPFRTAGTAHLPSKLFRLFFFFLLPLFSFCLHLPYFYKFGNSFNVEK